MGTDSENYKHNSLEIMKTESKLHSGKYGCYANSLRLKSSGAFLEVVVIGKNFEIWNF